MAAALHLPCFIQAPKFTPSISLPRHCPPPLRIGTPHSSSRLHSFLDLKPESSEPPLLDVDLPRHDPSDRRCREYDVLIIGAGPAGLRLAEQASGRGVHVCCIDPAPLLMWPNNYGVWVDEFQSMGLESCLDATWPMTTVYIDDRRRKFLGRAYGRVSRKSLKTKLLEACAASEVVKFHEAKALKVSHQEFKSSVECSDGSGLTASLVVDACGFASPFLEYDNLRPRNPGYQMAHGILAEVDEHPFDLDKMVLMDWRDAHMGNEPSLRAKNRKLPTFLYAMPFSRSLIFLEETSLVSRPMLSYAEVKERMVARLRHLGIKVRRVVEEEKCVIPMGGPLPRLPQSVLGVGGAAGLVHPSTGYMVAKSLAAAAAAAEEMAECLGSTRMIRGRTLQRRVWERLWPAKERWEREFYCFGMETLLKLDLEGTRGFFDAFFELESRYWHGFLSRRLSLGELGMLSLSLFGHASNPSRLDIVTKCPLPLARMVGHLAVEAV